MSPFDSPEAPNNATYAVVVDDFSLEETPEQPDSLLMVSSLRPYTVFLNGEEIGSGQHYDTAERFLVRPRVGSNVLAIAVDARDANDDLAVALTNGRRSLRSGDSGWFASPDPAEDWASETRGEGEISIATFEDCVDWNPVEAEDAQGWTKADAALGDGPTRQGVKFGESVSVFNGRRVSS